MPLDSTRGWSSPYSKSHVSDTERRVASVMSYGAIRFSGVQKHKFPFPKVIQERKSRDYLCKFMVLRVSGA